MRALKLTLLVLLLFSTSLFAQFGRGGDNRWGSGAWGTSSGQQETANTAPVITAVPDTTVTELDTLVIAISATDPDGDALTMSITDTPTGAVFVDNGDNTATLTWEIAIGQAGSYTPTFTATDPGGLFDSTTPTITVDEAIAFRSTWTVGATDKTVTFPLTDSAVDFWIDWGDGSALEHIETNSCAHTYASAGTYATVCKGTLKGWQFNKAGDRLKIVGISEWGCFDMSTDRCFFGCANLDISATDAPVVTYFSMQYTFHGCSKLTSIGDPSSWDVSPVTNMSYTFSLCTIFNQDIGAWDVSNVTSMSQMFASANAFNQSLAAWNPIELLYTTCMFRYCATFNQPFGAWNSVKLKNIGNLNRQSDV